MEIESYISASKRLKTLAWIICLVATLCYSYDFFIRAAPGAMGNELRDAFDITETQLGFLSSAYFISYTIMQIPAGVIIDKYNRMIVLSIAVALSVLGNYMFSATNDFYISFLGRIFMGIGSAFGFIGAAKMAAMWLPSRLYGSFVSFATTVGILGGLFTSVILASLVESLGWKLGNDIFTLIGLILLLLVILVIKDNPKHVEKYQHLNDSNLKETLKKLGHIFMNHKFWATSIIGAILFIPLNVLANLWGVGFIQAKFTIEQTDASHLNSFLFIGAAFGFTFTAFISSKVHKYRLMIVISIISLIIIFLALLYIDMSIEIFTFFYFLLGFVAGPQALTFAIARTISPKGTVGTSAAGVNTINNLIPIILLPLVGFILTHFGVLLDDENTIYTIQSYQHSLIVVVFMLLICLPLAMILPKEGD